MSHSGKVESGAQLLARLGPRPSLDTLQTALPRLELSPGAILELYGEEGVGKTELLLHLISSAVLPDPGHQQGSHGNQTEVMWVDCDLKFSVLRLAVLLEQRIVSNRYRGEGSVQESGDSVTIAGGEPGDCCVKGETERVGEKGDSQDFAGGHSKNYDHRLTDADSDSVGTGVSDAQKLAHSHSLATTSKSGSAKSFKVSTGLKRKAANANLEIDEANVNEATVSVQSGNRPLKQLSHSDDKFATRQAEKIQTTQAEKIQNTFKPSDRDGEQMSDSAVQRSGADDVSAEEVEKRVEECLQRVHVAHCSSSQQLICTLYSLESVIAANRNIALLVIDSISAFYWSDRCSDRNQSSSLVHKNISYIASVLKKISDSYGVLVIATKQALIRPQARRKAESGMSFPEGASSVGTKSDNHVEFLGKAWSDLVTHRCVCSKQVRSEGKVKRTHYTLTSATGSSPFTIHDSGVCFDQ